MRKSTTVALSSVALVSIAVRLSPLWSFLYWGSDTGEYFSILRALVRSGHLSTTYYGWGVTYPYFPGMFFAQVGFVDLGGLDVPTTINLLVPILGALAVLPMFLVAHRMTGDDRFALFAAAFLAGAIPVAYTAAHTAPATVGELLALAGLLCFVGLARLVSCGPHSPRRDHLRTQPGCLEVSDDLSGAPPPRDRVPGGRGNHLRDRRGLGRHRGPGNHVSGPRDRAALLRPARPPVIVRGVGPPFRRFPRGRACGERLVRRPPRLRRCGNRRGPTRPDSVPTRGVPDDPSRNLRGDRVLPALGPRGPSRWEADLRPRPLRRPPRRECGRRHPAPLHARGLEGRDDPRGVGPRVLGEGPCERTRRVGPPGVHDGLRIRWRQCDVGPDTGSILAGIRERPVCRPRGHRLAIRGEKRDVYLDRPRHGSRRTSYALGNGRPDGSRRDRKVRRGAVHQGLRQRIRAALLDRVGQRADVLGRTHLWPAIASRRSMRIAVLHDHMSFIGGGGRGVRDPGPAVRR